MSLQDHIDYLKTLSPKPIEIEYQSNFLIITGVSDYAYASSLFEEVDFSAHALDGIVFLNGDAAFGFNRDSTEMEIGQIKLALNDGILESADGVEDLNATAVPTSLVDLEIDRPITTLTGLAGAGGERACE